MQDPQAPLQLAYVDEADSTRGAVQGLVRFLQLLRRKKHIVGGALFATLAIGVAYFTFATRYYESAAKLMVIKQTPDQVTSVGEQTNFDTVMASQRELIRTPKVVMAAIERLPAEHRTDLIDVPPHRWVAEISNRLSASTVRKTNHMEVRYQSRAPEAAAAVVSAVIESYLEFVQKSHRTGAADVLDALTGERDQLSHELVAKQGELQRFRQQIGHLALQADSGTVEPIIGRALFFNQALVEAQQRRIELQASLATVQRAIQNREDLRRHLAVIEEVVGQQMLLAALGLSPQDSELLAQQQDRLMQAQGELRRVSQYLGENHPTTITLKEQVASTQQYLASYHTTAGDRFAAMDNNELAPLLVNMLNQSVNQAVASERQMLASFESARSAAVRQSGDLAQLQMLEREVDRIEQQHDILFDKIATVDIHQVQAPIRVSIVQDPLPNEIPASPKLRDVLVMATFSGILLGSMIVYLQDVLDDRFGSPEEMASQLGVPVLSLVKMLQPTGGSGLGAIQMHAGGDQVDLEAFRTLRTALALNGDVADRLMISSAEPSDGKTTISANLAVAFTQVGKRTLVIDADLRKPGMTALLELKGKPGVTDLLVTQDSAAELAEKVVCPSGLEGLDVIPAGPRRPDAAELLAGKNFADVLAWADSRYDQVLVDCPPVLAVSDAQIVGRLVDGVVLVVSPEKNHRRLVSRACDTFLSAGIHVFGVVANRITEQTGGDYGYGYGYGYAYGEDPNDEADDDQRVETPPILAASWDELADCAAEDPGRRAA